MLQTPGAGHCGITETPGAERVKRHPTKRKTFKNTSMTCILTWYCCYTSRCSEGNNVYIHGCTSIFCSGQAKPYKDKSGKSAKADRIVSPQPLKFGDSFNLRKLNNLPYHAVEARNKDLLKKECLLNFNFLQSKLISCEVRYATCLVCDYFCLFSSLWFIIIINPLTTRVVGAPQMILQPVFSIFSCSPLPSGTCRTPGLSIPWCCLPTSSFVRLVFFSLSLCLARWFWPDLMNGRHDHTTAVCVSLRSSGDLHVVQLPAGSWHGLPRW